jgi:hypothetical protein
MGAINTDFIVEIPVSNVLRFTRMDAVNNQRANVDQVKYSEAKHATNDLREYAQLIEKADFSSTRNKTQFYTNYPLRRLQVLDENDAVSLTYTPTLLRAYRNKKYRSDCKCSSIEGKLFIYFDSGVEYSDEDFTVTGDQVDLAGRLPSINAVAGNIIRVKVQDEAFQTDSIVSIEWSPTLQSEGFLTDIDMALVNPVDGLVEVTYNEKEVDLFSRTIDFSGLDDGIYSVKLSFALSDLDGEDAIHFITESIDLATLHTDTLGIEYTHTGDYDDDEQWSYVYEGGITNIIRFPAEFYKFDPSGEVDIYEDDSGIDSILRAVPKRQLKFEALNIPSWVADKLTLVFSHDSKTINGYQWENKDYGSFNLIGRADIGTFEINLTQKDDRRVFNTTESREINASFTPDEETGIAFAGDTFTVVFNSNISEIFQFRELPAWLSADVETFIDGDEIEFTVAANATAYDRAIELVAYCDNFPTLEATLQVAQLHDAGAVFYLDMPYLDTSDTYSFNGGAGLINNFLVSHSGSFSIGVTGFAFTVEQVMLFGSTHLRVTTPSANNTAFVREAVITLTLDADPLITQVLNIEQQTVADSMEITSVTPSNVTKTYSGQTFNVDVDVIGSATYQAVTSQSWITVSGAIKTGDQTISITLSQNSGAYPRGGTVRFINTLNPADYITLTILQNTA